jgi:hypothetical protein
MAESPVQKNSQDTGTDPEYHGGLSYEIDQLCDVLVPHISRCRSIFICIDNHFTSLLDALHMHLRNQAAPLLEWLFLQIPDSFTADPPPPAPTFTRGAPMLSYIHLSRASILCQRPPFHHVTALHLEAEDMEFAQCLTVVSQCPLLQTLAIYGNLEVQMDVEPLVLPYLRSLELCGDMGVVADVLLAVSAPSLESLVIVPFDTVDLKELHHEEGLGPKRYATLKSLTLAPYYSSLDESLKLASECFPYVVDTTLIGRKSDFLIEGLTNTDGAVIFPNMQSLALRNLDSPLQEALCSLVAFRDSMDRPLHTLYLDKASIRQMSSLRQLWDAVEVVELDKWSILRRGSLFCDEEHETFYPPT